jgi:hypothetical protein
MSDSGLKSESSLGYSAAFPTAGTKRKLVSESSGPNVKAKTATFTRSSSLVKLESGVDGSSDKDLHKTVRFRFCAPFPNHDDICYFLISFFSNRFPC